MQPGHMLKEAERTKGGHRRFSREKLDAYLGKTKRGRSVRPEAGARRPPPRASRAQRIPEPPDDDPEDLELMDAEVEAAVEVPPPVRVPQPNPLERLGGGSKRHKTSAGFRRLSTTGSAMRRTRPRSTGSPRTETAPCGMSSGC